MYMELYRTEHEYIIYYPSLEMESVAFRPPQPPPPRCIYVVPEKGIHIRCDDDSSPSGMRHTSFMYDCMHTRYSCGSSFAIAKRVMDSGICI